MSGILQLCVSDRPYSTLKIPNFVQKSNRIPIVGFEIVTICDGFGYCVYVILDSCVIYPMPLCDTLMRAAEAGLYELHFSQEILNGATRNLVKNEVMTDAKAAYFQGQIKTHFPEALVEVPSQLIAATT